MRPKYFIDYSNPSRTTAATMQPDIIDWLIDHGYTEVSRTEYMIQCYDNTKGE